MSDQDGPTRFGFRWGPMEVNRLAHIDGRGYALEVKTDTGAMQVYVSEKGRVVEAYPFRKKPGGVDR